MENQLVYTYNYLYSESANKIATIIKPKYGNVDRTKNKIVTLNGMSIRNVHNIRIQNFDTYLVISLLSEKDVIASITLDNGNNFVEKYNSMIDAYFYDIETK